MEDKVILAGGCFWCTESAFSDVVGIRSIRSGYTGGITPSPTYEEVCQGNTGHFEAVEIVFDTEEITFLQILELFWRQIDPTDSGGQFFDRGSQYRTAIFYSDLTQKHQAERSKQAIERLLGKKVVTEILPAEPFYPAEEYHQNYCRKQPEHYKRYREGHQARLKELWGSIHAPSSDDLKEILTPLQYKVTQEAATEPPFHNTFWDNKKEGIYVDVVSGEPLFSSLDKFDSGTGWPCFVRPLKSESIIEEDDWKLGVKRTEVKSSLADSHLGHVFPDGPAPTHLRYCINSAALRFIPKEKLKEEGYEEYLALFEQGW